MTEDYINDENENVRAFMRASIANAVEEQVKANRGKSIKELEAQEMIDDIMAELKGTK